MSQKNEIIVENMQLLIDFLKNQVSMQKNEIKELKEQLDNKDCKIKELENKLNQVECQTNLCVAIDNNKPQNQLTNTSDTSENITLKMEFESEDEDVINENSFTNSVNNIIPDNENDCSINLNPLASNYMKNETKHLFNKCEREVPKANLVVSNSNGKYKIKFLNKGIVSDDNRIMCPCCTTTFNSRVCVRQHLFLVHLCKNSKDKVMYRCHICEERFEKMKVLSEHLDSHKCDAGVVECCYCRSLFKDNLTFRNHSRFLNCVKFNNIA